MAYSEKVLDHYENPRNVGSFGKSEAGVGIIGVLIMLAAQTDVGVVSELNHASLGILRGPDGVRRAFIACRVRSRARKRHHDSP